MSTNDLRRPRRKVFDMDEIKVVSYVRSGEAVAFLGNKEAIAPIESRFVETPPGNSA